MTKEIFIAEVCKAFESEVGSSIDTENVSVDFGKVYIENIYEYSIEIVFDPIEKDWEVNGLCKENAEEFVGDMKGYEAIAEYIWANYDNIEE